MKLTAEQIEAIDPRIIERWREYEARRATIPAEVLQRHRDDLARLATLPQWLPERLRNVHNETERQLLIGVVDDWLFEYDEDTMRPRAVKAAKAQPGYVFDAKAYRESVEACRSNRPYPEDAEIDSVLLPELAREVVERKITLDAARSRVDEAITARVNSFLRAKVEVNPFDEKRTGERTHRVIKMLLDDHTLSDALIAREVGLARQTVAKIRRSMEASGRIPVYRPKGGRP